MDYETQTSGVDISVTVTDSGGASFSRSFTITPSNINEPPTAITLSSSSVNEKSAAAVVGTLSATDQDSGDSAAFSITNDPSGKFEISGSTLQLQSGQSLNYQTEASTVLTIQVTDGGGATFSDSVTISTLNLVEFVDVTVSQVSQGSNAETCSWGDYDGDQDPDLYIGVSGATSHLIRNDGGGAFTDVSAAPIGSANTRGTAWGDYDSDGDLDLLEGILGGPLVFQNNSGTLANDPHTDINAISSNVRVVMWGDYDGDEDLDLFMGRATVDANGNRLFRNDGSSFTSITSQPVNAADESWTAAWGDYDKDGDLDLYVGNFGDPNRLFRNDSGTLLDISSPPTNNTGDTRGVGWVDYDGDHDLDIYVSNQADNQLYRNDETFFTEITGSPINDTGSARGFTWGDYDLDGDLDLFVANWGTENKLFRNDGSGVFVDVSSSPINDTGNGRGAQFVDYDSDGDLDLYVVNSGDNILYQNESTPQPNSYIKLELLGTGGIRTTHGIVMTLLDSGTPIATRIAGGGTGYTFQSFLPTYFYNLDSGTSYDLRVYWPDGTVTYSIGTPTTSLKQVQKGSGLL